MLFADAVYVGIDPTAGRRPFQYAALDGKLQLLALDSGDMESVLAFVGGLERAIVAVDAPQSPNQGLMLLPEIRRGFDLLPEGRTWGQWKVCEYELRRRNIRLYNTPEKEEDAARWVQMGFAIFRRLEEQGFQHFVAEQALGLRTMLEVHPHACFAVLLGHRPFLKKTIEGRMQRQLVLYLEGLDLQNPLRSLEEITRHHLLSGRLPLENLLEHDELDALIAAFTAYLVGVKPERVSQVGDQKEGLITLPTADLKHFYR